jgi:hypothetical protein
MPYRPGKDPRPQPPRPPIRPTLPPIGKGEGTDGSGQKIPLRPQAPVKRKATAKSNTAGAKEFYRSIASSANRGTKPFTPALNGGAQSQPDSAYTPKGKTAADIRREALIKKATKK